MMYATHLEGIKCVACLTGKVWECITYGQCNKDSDRVPSSDDSVPSGLLDLLEDSEESRENDAEDVGSGSDQYGIPSSSGSGPVREVNTYKDDAVLKDQQSTGRKRAAVMYPLDEESDCEWARQSNCGGGSYPIVGCLDGKQQARHHGPDKNTLNNEGGNVHRICHNCHNRWHTKNDETYVWGSIYPQHDPTAATLAELQENIAYWSSRTVVRAKD